MPSLKTIRKRISSVKSTQKITRAMKMVAGARLARAQTRIVQMRPYALKLQELIAEVVTPNVPPHHAGEQDEAREALEPDHPLLVERAENRLRKSVTHDGDAVDACRLHDLEQFLRIERAAGHRCDGATECECPHCIHRARAVHQWRRGHVDRAGL